MKKSANKILCLALIVLLISSMAVPAAARSGSYEYGGYSLNFTVTGDETYGMASISTRYKPTTLGAYVVNYVYCEACGSVAFVDSGHTDAGVMTPNNGYAYAVAYAYNEFTNNSGPHEGIVQQTKGSFWVEGTLVLGHVLADS